tara:strand:+ start:339 stop:596 length:258 start_codon:yes stop_codon:yes gene_type:complete
MGKKKRLKLLAKQKKLQDAKMAAAKLEVEPVVEEKVVAPAKKEAPKATPPPAKKEAPKATPPIIEKKAPKAKSNPWQKEKKSNKK